MPLKRITWTGQPSAMKRRKVVAGPSNASGRNVLRSARLGPLPPSLRAEVRISHPLAVIWKTTGSRFSHQPHRMQPSSIQIVAGKGIVVVSMAAFGAEGMRFRPHQTQVPASGSGMASRHLSPPILGSDAMSAGIP